MVEMLTLLVKISDPQWLRSWISKRSLGPGKWCLGWGREAMGGARGLRDEARMGSGDGVGSEELVGSEEITGLEEMVDMASGVGRGLGD